MTLFRLAKAEAVGLTYEEYTLELLERGRHVQKEDAVRIAEIKARRRRRPVRHLELTAEPKPRSCRLVF